MGYVTSDSGSLAADRIAYEGGRNVSYDLDGSKKSFKLTREYVYYNLGQEQIIELPFPSYCLAPAVTDAARRTGITVTAIGEYRTSSSVSATKTELKFVQDYQNGLDSNTWTYEESDQTSMATAMRLWNRIDYDFNGIITRRIRVKAGMTKVILRVEMQRFYTDIIDQFTGTNVRGPLYTRELGQYILNKLDDLDVRSEVIQRNMFGTTSAASDILDEDLTGTADDNRVWCELHEVHTERGQTLLAPAKGSFYPGTFSGGTRFAMYKFYTESGTVTDDMIYSGSRNGWLFIFNVNNMKAFSSTGHEVFMPNVAYYAISRATGDHVLLTPGKDYGVGDSVEAWKNDNDNTSKYTADVFERLNVPYDPSKGFDGAVNDTSAYIVKEVRVLLTPDNIIKYRNYTGKFVDVSLATAYKLATGEFGEKVTYYTRSGGVGSYVFTMADTTDKVGTTIPDNTYYTAVESINASKVFVYGTDYLFGNVNLAKTERTFSNQPVYDHIRLLKTFSTDDTFLIGITYQAFGGQVNVDDVRDIRKDVTNLSEILGATHLLTSEGLSKHELIKSIQARLARVETYNDHFAQVDHQVYKGSTGVHWINIAAIYDVVWMNSVDVIKEVGQFRISSKDRGWCYEFAVSVDASKGEDGILKVTTLAANTTHSRAKLNAIPDVSNIEHIMLRLCWNEYVNSATGKVERGKRSGLVLQLGFDWGEYGFNAKNDPYDNDIITVVNKSSHTSMWKLYNDPLEVTKYNDSTLDTYGHVQYVPFQGAANAADSYYVDLVEYLYYQTSSLYMQPGVEYFRLDNSTYIKLASSQGTDISSLGYDVYERVPYRHVWQKTYLTNNQAVSEADGIYTVDTSSSYDDNSFDFLDKTVWSPLLMPDVSKYSTIILESDNDGWTAWAGCYPLHQYSFGPGKSGQPLVLHCSLSSSIQSHFNLRKIGQLIMTIFDRRTGQWLHKTIDMCPSPDSDNGTSVSEYCSGDCMFFLEDMCGCAIRLDRKTAAEVVATIDVGLGTSSYINQRFDLRQLQVKF